MLRETVNLICRIALGCVLISALPAGAQDYPARLVRFIVPQAPGGATDVFARAVGQRLSARWSQSVVVENRAGAAGTVGTDVVAKSPPDGYTLLVTYAGSQAINQSLYPKLPFDSVRDFQTVATLAVTPNVPTIAESGVPKFDVNPWWGILAPAGTDMRVVRKINADVADVLKTAEMQSFFAAQGAEAFLTTPEQFLKILVADVEKWAKVVKASGARID